jgi:hypothetical protein
VGTKLISQVQLIARVPISQSLILVHMVWPGLLKVQLVLCVMFTIPQIGVHYWSGSGWRKLGIGSRIEGIP